jgi:hypothetical protein
MRILAALLLIVSTSASAQLKWTNVDSLFGPLPASVHVYHTNDSLDGKPNIAYYVIADLKDKALDFTTDTSKARRLTPSQFYRKNEQALVVVNCTFFSFETNRNLNMVMRKGKLLAFNTAIPLRGKDTLKFLHAPTATFGIDKKRHADIAWTFTGTQKRKVWAQTKPSGWIDSIALMNMDSLVQHSLEFYMDAGMVSELRRWKMRTAVGGGPVLLEHGITRITNNEERKFAGKAINDKHPRTAMGYTKDNKLIILVVQGRFPGAAEGATLTQEARMLLELGCVEALNLDGGGSSCMLVNGKETIKPSDKAGEQRAVPAVFLIKTGR